MKIHLFLFLLCLFVSGDAIAKQKYSLVINGFANHLGQSYVDEKTYNAEPVGSWSCNKDKTDCNYVIDRFVSATDTVEKKQDLNENNLGTGVEIDVNFNEYITVGTYIDSFNSSELYAGFGTWRNIVRHNSLSFDYGGTALIMTHSVVNNGNPLIVPVPTLSIGYKRFHINMAYTPRFNKATPAVLFFQSKIDLYR